MPAARPRLREELSVDELARRAGADFFLAPADNCAEVVGHVPSGLRVVKVESFDDGAAAVRDIGTGKASSLPTCG